jgi:hypothetical protein
MSKNRVFYQALAVHVSNNATGYSMSSGNSGDSLLRSLTRLQSVNDSFTLNRQNVNQLGQLGIIGQIITEPPTVPIEMSWNVADVSNDLILGLYVSGDQGALTNILNTTQAEKNYFIEVAPEGIDAIGWTGESQVKYVTNGFLTSYSTEGAVGGLPTTTVGAQGFNWATATGSTNQPLYAVDIANNVLTTGVRFSLGVASSGLAGAVAAIRPSEITATIGSPLGLLAADVKLQRYNVSVNLNNQRLTQMGKFFPYAIVPQFPVEVTASVTAYWGDLTTGSLSTLLCNDTESNIEITLRQPSCMGQAPGAVAARYTLAGAKLTSQSFSDAISDIASQVTLNYTTTIGGPTDTAHNLFISGISAV